MEVTVLPIIPGIYQYHDPSNKRHPTERYNLLSVSTSTESTLDEKGAAHYERLILCQRLSSPFLGMLILLPLQSFLKKMKTGLFKRIERYQVPTIKYWESGRPRKQPGLFGVQPGLHGHFKNPAARYNVIGVAMHFENWGEYAVYQPLYGEHRYAIRHRPVSMFTEVLKDRMVSDDIYNGPRFFKIEEVSPPAHIIVEYQD